jgi:hypothetical protein
MRKQLQAVHVGVRPLPREGRSLDAKFRAGTWGKKSFQWPPAFKEERDADQRPA